MSDAASPRHPFELVLEQLMGRMSTPGAPMRHGFGTEEDARRGAPGEMIWVPNGFAETVRSFTDRTDTVITWLACDFLVNAYGGSPLAVYGSVGELCGWLQVLLGQKNGAPPSQDGSRPMAPGYASGRASGPVGGSTASSAWASQLPVTLYSPIRSVIYPLGMITRFGLTVLATGGLTPDEIVVQEVP